MKKLLFLLLAAVILLGAAPRSFAYERSSWHDADKITSQLQSRFANIVNMRRQFGEDRVLHDQIARLHAGVDHLSYLVSNRVGDPDLRHKEGENLSDLASQIEAEYRHGPAHVYHVW